MNLAKSGQIKIALLAVFSLTVIIFSTSCLEKGGYCIMPIYVMLLHGLGLPSVAFASILVAIIWFFLGVFSPKVSSNIIGIFNMVTTLIGGWWLFSSKAIAMTYSSVTFYTLSIALFVVVQALCWLWGMRLKAASDFNYTRSILTILIALNLSWTFMTSFGIH